MQQIPPPETPAPSDAAPVETPWRERAFGRMSWQRPAWWMAASDALLRHRRAAAACVGIGLLVAGGYWLATRPRPVDPNALQVTVHAPALTDYDKTPAKVDALTLVFSASAAPLADVGKAPKGVRMQPALPGKWVWSDDHTLTFAPTGDWPVGQDFEVDIDRASALAPKIKLADDTLHFHSAPFNTTLHSSEFYQDPVDPALKKAVFEFAFSHPVDAAQFERRITLALHDGADTALAAPAHTVSYDEHRLKAWVHTDPLHLPDNGGVVMLTLAAGTTSLLGGGGTSAPVEGKVKLPSLYSVSVDSLDSTLVDNAKYEPEQVLVVAFNNAMRDTDVTAATHAWLLPAKNPKIALNRQHGFYSWSEGEIDGAVLAKSQPLPLSAIPAEREYIETHSFRYQAPPGRMVFVHIGKGLKAFGGFILGKSYSGIATVPDYPQLLRFVGDGALLSLHGERRVTVVSRNLGAARLEIGRVLPGQLQHLVFGNKGSYAKPELSGIEADSLVDRVEKRLQLPHDDPAKAHYEGVDLGEFLAPSRHGVFLLSLRTLDEGDQARSAQQTIADDAGEEKDSRLIVLTDLGIIAKRALDGSRDVFVQSLAHGTPVAGARVKAIARNGEVLADSGSGADGRAHLPSLADFKREKQPVMLTIEKDDDLSFLPIDDQGRALDYSRFDIGGEPNDVEAGSLNAFLFSDRGLYRPGDTIHIGMIVRASDWKHPLLGLPLEAVLTDPRGVVARRQKLSLSAAGFESLDYTPQDSAPSGTWQVDLSLVGRGDRRTPIGQTSVQVREFAPDTMRVSARLSSESTRGWVKPDLLKAVVSAQNLFGTPAQQRKVEATLVLRPAFPAFAQFPGFRFYDPQRAKDGYNESLSDGQTDANGLATFNLDLNKYVHSTYQLQLLARVFEPGSGRNVAAQTSMLVSSNPYLIGIKDDGDLTYVKRNAARAVQLLAVGPDGRALAVPGLRAAVVERRYVSVLTKEDSGLYRYVSRERRYDRDVRPLALAASAQPFVLPTQTPGDYDLEVRDAAGTVLNQIAFSIAGAANLTRSLDRNAELALTLSKTSYKPGETIELSVRAPYAGSGLITIERDKVYAQAWFKTDTTASVQHITVPADFEGNGYVNVQFLRDPSSDEVFMSPLSYGVAAFAVDRSARQLPLQLHVPAKARPGAPIAVDITTQGPSRVVVFAVDEGILQVAHYRVGDPLDYFFKKKMLQVDTAQILDLVLPEFSRLIGLVAPGGDSDGDLSKNLNPFKRKSEKPAVWWSGIIDVDGKKRVTFTLPDYFNGQVRVAAVAVTPQRVALADTELLVRGDFVLTPTVPTHVAPGDEFELPVGIANTIDGATQPIRVGATLALPKTLTLVGAAPAALSIKPGSESTQRFRLRAGDVPGVAQIVIRVASGRYVAQRRIELSVRPATVSRTQLRIGRVDTRSPVEHLRTMYDQQATRQLSASTSPLVALDGLSAYLRDYPHLCTEQLLSAGIPALVFTSHPEFGKVVAPPGLNLVDVLRSRQNSEGGLGMWAATPDSDPFISGYAGLYLLEARERGLALPDDMLRTLDPYLESLAADASRHDMAFLRSRALAVYLLVRQGRTATNLLSAVQAQVRRDQPRAWQNDVTGMLLASTYKLLQQDRPALELANRALAQANAPKPTTPRNYDAFSDDNIDHAWRVYLLDRHFPTLAAKLQPIAQQKLIDPIRDNSYNTLSSALTILALEAGVTTHGAASLPTLQAQNRDGSVRAIGTAQGVVQRGDFLGSDVRLWVTPATAASQPAWYVVNQSGFDHGPPIATQDHGLEVIRDYLGGDGKPVTTMTLGQEVTVRIRIRARGAASYSDIAITDLLPGGFEPVLQAPVPVPAKPSNAQPDAEGGDTVDGSDSADESDGRAQDTPTEKASTSDAPPQQALAMPGSTFEPEHVEQREDRVVLYGSATPNMQEFRYRVRANNAGRFLIPPIHAESMYQRSVFAQGGPAGSLQVTASPP